MKGLFKRIAHRMGYELELRKYDLVPGDMGDERFSALFAKCRPYTMTEVYRSYSMYNAVKYIVENKIPGDIVECGVWRGGIAMLSALLMMELGDTSRHIYLYDTFEGMSEPTEKDVAWRYGSVKDFWQKSRKNGITDWCYASIEEVTQNLYSTGYPKDKLHFIKGKVEETIPGTIPSQVGILRLDTDWYESTYHELVHLYPLVTQNGVVILDDYGFWKGSREAVDQYFKEKALSPLLNRIDGPGRMFIKTN
jgi:O-methyltransferase